MPGSKKTPNFEFPYYGPLDTFSPLVTYNGLAQQLDNILKTLQTKGEQNGTLIAEVQDALDAVHASVDANTTLINQINANSEKWNHIMMLHIFHPTAAAGVDSVTFVPFFDANHHIIFQISYNINVPNATVTDAGNYKLVDVFSAPETIPFLRPDIINYDTAVQIGGALGYWTVKGNVNREMTELPLFVYRNQNVTRFFVKVDAANFENLQSLVAFSSLNYGYIG